MVNDCISNNTIAPHLQLPHVFCLLVKKTCCRLTNRIGLSFNTIFIGEGTRHKIHHGKTWIVSLQISLIKIHHLEVGIVHVSRGITEFFIQLSTQSIVACFEVQLYRHTLCLGNFHHQLNITSQIYPCLIARHLGETVQRVTQQRIHTGKNDRRVQKNRINFITFEQPFHNRIIIQQNNFRFPILDLL